MHIKITKYTAVMLINSVIDIFYLLSLKEILNSITTNDPMVFKWFIFMATIIFLRYFIRKIELHVRERYLESSENKITESYIENIFSYNSKSFYNKSIGDYLSYISNDIQAYMENYIKVQPLYHVAIISCVIYAAIALLSGGLFSLAMIAVSLLGLLTMKVFSPMQQKKQEEYIQYRPIFVSHLKDYIAGKREIRQYNAESPFMGKFDSIAKEDGEKQKKINIIKDIARSFDTLFFYSIVFINYTICAYGICKGHLYVGDMVFLTQLASGITEYISQISRYKIMMNSVKLDESLPTKQIKSDTIIADNLKKIQTIELNGVTVTYGDKCILDNVSYTFEENHSYMIIGKSGSGKSTFLQLLLKINEDYLGDIYLNDINLKHINKKNLYENIGYIPQDTFIFNKTVEENITFEKSRSINDLLEKLNIEHLEAAILSQNGENISQGERKRIDIARNLWNTPDVLLSDEATTSLDLKNKLDITKRLTENKNFILISVSHDYTDEMIQMYDHIMELNSGKLMEVDKNEIYKKA